MPTPSSARPCALCHEPIPDVYAPGVHVRTIGWVKRRRDGGGHAVALPERLNEWAHGGCVQLMASGNWLQQSLI